MADVAMEIWGKAAGGREAAAHLVFVCCVCVLSVCAMFCTCRFFGFVSGIVEFFVRRSYVDKRLE